MVGLAARKVGNVEAALRAYEAVCCADAAHVEGHFLRGNCLLELGRAAEAVEAFEVVLHAAPDHHGAAINLGVALRSCTRFDDAVEIYQRMLARRNVSTTMRQPVFEIRLGL